MITIKYRSGRLLFDDNGANKSFPYSVFANGDVVTITSLGSGAGSVSADYTQWQNEDTSTFADADELIDYLTQYSGFNTAPGGSGAGSPRFDYGKLTQTQINELTGMSAGDTVYNTTINKDQIYNSTFGWVGMSERPIFMQCGQSNLSTTQQYFGNNTAAATTSVSVRDIKILKPEVLTGANFRMYISGTQGDKLITLAVFKNGASVATIDAIPVTSRNLYFQNSDLGITGVSVVAGDTISIGVIASGGTTDSTGVYINGDLIAQ